MLDCENFVANVKPICSFVGSGRTISVKRGSSRKSLSFGTVDSTGSGGSVHNAHHFSGSMREVEISNIPSPFVKDIFLNFINDLIDMHNLSEVKNAVVSLGEYQEQSKSVVVEFVTAAIAGKFSRLENIDFVLHPLSFEQGTLPYKTCTSRHLKVSNIPSPFNKDLVCGFLETLFYQQGLKAVEEDTIVLHCSEYCNDDKSVTVELTTSYLVEKALEFKNVFFLFNELKFQKMKSPATSCITFCGIRPPYNEVIFLKYVETFLQMEGIHTSDMPAVVSCSPYNTCDQSVTLKFSSPALAEKALPLTWKFLLKDLKLKPAPEVPQEAKVHENNNYIFPSNASGSVVKEGYVKVSNLRENFEKESFKQVLNSKMIDAGFIDESEMAVVSCSQYSAALNTVVVKFQTLEYAQLASCLENVVFRGSTIYVKHLQIEEEESTLRDLPHDKPLLTLDTRQGYIKFVRLLVKERHTFGQGQRQDSALARIHLKLKAAGVVASVEELKTARARAKVKYNSLRNKGKGQNEWEFFNAFAVINGHKDIAILDNTEYSGDFAELDASERCVDQHSVDVSKFMKGRVFSKTNTRLVIALCLKYKDDFHNPGKDVHFFRKISREVFEKSGEKFHPEQCESLMTRNRALFKSEVQRLGSSGAAGPQSPEAWEFFEDMLPLMKGDVSVWPLVLACAGTSVKLSHALNNMSSRDVLDLATLEDNTTRSRTAKRSSAERRTVALEKVAESLENSRSVRDAIMKRLNLS